MAAPIRQGAPVDLDQHDVMDMAGQCPSVPRTSSVRRRRLQWGNSQFDFMLHRSADRRDAKYQFPGFFTKAGVCRAGVRSLAGCVELLFDASIRFDALCRRGTSNE
jgi:hypothetical protein